MKLLYALAVTCAAILGYKVAAHDEVTRATILKQKIFEQFKDFTKKLAEVKSEDDLVGSSGANVNDFIDSLLPGVDKAILEAGYDPTSLPDQTIHIGIGKSHLTEGTLTELSTMERYEDATVTYDSDAKKAYIDFILRWQELELVYKYHTKVVFISMTGHVTAKLEHMKIHLKLGFDFNTDHVTVDSLDFKHTGDISLKFTGNKVIDRIMNAMSKAFTTIFHNMIISEVKKVAMDPIESIVDSINQDIDQILHP